MVAVFREILIAAVRNFLKDLRGSGVTTENPMVVSLDASYKEILPDSWVVVDRAYPEANIPQPLISRAVQVRERSRADYGMNGPSTQITLSQPWLNLQNDTFAIIRGTRVYAQSELLKLARCRSSILKLRRGSNR
jgi:hypothetical protein